MLLYSFKNMNRNTLFVSEEAEQAPWASPPKSGAVLKAELYNIWIWRERSKT